MSEEKAPEQTRVISDREARFPKYRLVVTEGPDVGSTVQGAGEEIAIGTSDANDLVLADPAVSRHHIAIAPSARGLLLRDLGSTNGTTLNSVVVERAYLAPGVVIGVGGTKLRFEPGGGDARAALSKESRWGRALGASDAMRKIFAVLPKLAESDATILLEGETGTGKGLLASAIHEASPRAKGPFIVVDCGSIPPSLIESELFGHEKGSFTGASTLRIGAFEAGKGGTVFLDEIGELPLDMQPKLLRALEEKLVKRIGGNDQIKLDIRVIAATNRDLRSEINRGRFRSDVYYRLNTFRLRVPPLRERREDIAMLIAHFYEQLARGDTEPPAELIANLTKHDWPGNVRELRAAVERTVLLGDLEVWREITADPAAPAVAASPPPAFDVGVSFRAAKERAVAEWEREYVRTLIDHHGGNLSRAARAVRMDRNHLRELLVRHRIRVDDT
ncbi:MAG: sigma 54-dependent Fis family transcriptional regulator [Deltaproteobacteria bacterium]|nr:sigma 54-dependent Fis family transcriptional regulator [Deltaproteobacteria bacterium]